MEPIIEETMFRLSRAGISAGTKEFWLVSIGMLLSSCTPAKATRAAIRITGTGLWAIRTAIDARKRLYQPGPAEGWRLLLGVYPVSRAIIGTQIRDDR